MKKFLLTILPFIVVSYSYAQNIFPATGNVGVGTNTPDDLLDVRGNSLFGSSTERISLGGKSFAFNRRVVDGLIFDAGSFGYQMQHTGSSIQGNDYLAFQVYRPNGASVIPYALTINSFGKIGVGTITPSAQLSISGSETSVSNTNLPAIGDLSGNGDRARIAIGNTVTTANGSRSSAILMYGMNLAGNALENKWEIGTDYFMHGSNDFYFYNGLINKPALYIGATGNIGIGTVLPDQKLTVSGSIHASEVKIDQAIIPTPDYVFDENYDLATLKDVKTYIDKNHHLPEIPSAAQVAKDGIKLGEMNMKLLKKIEELTLYLIEKDNELSKQKLNNKDQQAQIDLLKEQMKSLRKNKG